MPQPPHRPDAPFSFSIAAEPRTSALVRGEVRRLYVFIDQETESESMVAISEIVQNAVDIHTSAGVDRPIDIECFADPPRIRITDHGPGFDTAAARANVPAPSAQSGRGLLLASVFVPDLTIHSGSEGTAVDIPLRGAQWIEIDVDPADP